MSSNATTGLVMGSIGVVGMIGMLANSWHSDRSGERVWHSALALVVVALGFAAVGLGGSAAWKLGGLYVITAGISAFLPPFWCIPSAMFTGTAAAAAIALINSIGNLGGYLGPMLLGRAKDVTGSYAAGMLALATLSLVAAAMIVGLRRPRHA